VIAREQARRRAARKGCRDQLPTTCHLRHHPEGAERSGAFPATWTSNCESREDSLTDIRAREHQDREREYRGHHQRTGLQRGATLAKSESHEGSEGEQQYQAPDGARSRHEHEAEAAHRAANGKRELPAPAREEPPFHASPSAVVRPFSL
jgi:hypothetical protein